MINGDPNAFIDKAYSAQEIFYKFREEEYMLQGYTADGQSHIEIQRHLPFSPNLIWSFEGSSMQECVSAFEIEPLFDGKTFWQAEEDIEWLD
ncbi:MAG: hypothetical protein KBS82_03475 [Oscillospiraceae bacterium]|nr:hypothetical protein [Candidatus Limimonas egerieequi]